MHLKTDVWLYISAAVSQKKCIDVNDYYLLCLYNVLIAIMLCTKLQKCKFYHNFIAALNVIHSVLYV